MGRSRYYGCLVILVIIFGHDHCRLVVILGIYLESIGIIDV